VCCVHRPRWERCSEIVSGGADYWIQATEGKTSDEIVDVLLAEIQDGGSGRGRSQLDYFDGLVSEERMMSVYWKLRVLTNVYLVMSVH